jgi:hypothetical protein
MRATSTSTRKPHLRLTGESGTYAISTNYENPAGTIQSFEYIVKFEDSLKLNRDQLRRLEKKEMELNRQEVRAPFQYEEKLIQMKRRQARTGAGARGGCRRQAGLTCCRGSQRPEESNRDHAGGPFDVDPCQVVATAEVLCVTNSGQGRRMLLRASPSRKRLVFTKASPTVKGGPKTWIVDHIPTGISLRKRFSRDFRSCGVCSQAGKGV